MTPFDIKALEETLFETFPEAGDRPVVGLSANVDSGKATLFAPYYESVVRAGGLPLIIPPTRDGAILAQTLDSIDALILTGGADINPLWSGEEPHAALGGINPERDAYELLLTRLAYNRQIPILGICRGIQTLVTALGGRVEQDIARRPDTIKHSQEAPRNEMTHTVSTVAGSTLAELYGERIVVNSLHHQAVGETGPRFRVTAQAPDGIIEAIESTEMKPIIGVQWHPEWLDNGGPLFQWLTGEARLFRRCKDIHARHLIFDSHCDTPMFFHQGVDIARRDSRILVDLHKMTDGRQDAVTMVAYLPQPKMGETFSSKVDLPADGPKAYADLIFDKIEAFAAANKTRLSIARTPADLYEDKRKGRKSIVLGIENGLALERDPANVAHFARRGVTYITLCHNGDNDICDSARGCNTHNGVSPFGAKIIAEMNRHGIMVDLSHGSEKSFYDALDISRTPIVCSHSNMKSLCDMPRNLTDDQVRALAAKGGVVQITLYKGFLRKAAEATILDAMDHLDHAVRLVGPEHVGLGTDFDGDGGITGCADASEMICFTRHLLRRRYSETDIERIWGGNWMRVMTLVQASQTV